MLHQVYYQKKKKQNQEKNAYHKQELENIFLKSFQQQKSRSVMMNSYFNEHEKSRYDLALYICDHDYKFYFFDNVDELREHVLKYHDVDTKFNIFKMQIRDTNHARHAEKHVYNYVSSNLFDYTTVQIEIFDLELSFCIDFDEVVNLLNKSILLRDNLYNIIHNAFSIIVIDVIERQVINQMIKLDVELSFNKISFKIIAYLMKNLSSELNYNQRRIKSSRYEFSTR